MSKGSVRRPQLVDRQTFASNWDRIFANPSQRDDWAAEDEAFARCELRENFNADHDDFNSDQDKTQGC